jgi:hypothetical protein
MAYDFVSASSQWLSYPQGNAPAIGETCTMACRMVIPTSGTDINAIIQFTDSANASPLRYLRWRSAQNRVQHTERGISPGNTFIEMNGGVAPSRDVWQSVQLVRPSVSSRTLYTNAGNAATNTTTQTTSTFNRFAIGALWTAASGTLYFYQGQIAEVAVWNADLTVDELVALNKGFKPYRIRPQSLIAYAPLVRTLFDVVSPRTITNNNSATVADHPRVY